MSEKAPPRLEFSEKYTSTHAEQYFHKHQTGFWRNISNRREQAMARKALRLAGNPTSVLDLPCGTGRFWGLLAEKPGRTLYAADYSRHMLRVGKEMRPQDITRRIHLFQCSAFAIPWPDNAVESVFSMRLVHHIGRSEDRIILFREFGRVAADTVCLSLWVGGNVQARRRRRLESRRKEERYQNRFVLSRSQVEAEFREAGLEIMGHVDFLRFWSMWRIYILRTPRY
jgi:SAM-dependent methyltransferase